MKKVKVNSEIHGRFLKTAGMAGEAAERNILLLLEVYHEPVFSKNTGIDGAICCAFLICYAPKSENG